MVGSTTKKNNSGIKQKTRSAIIVLQILNSLSTNENMGKTAAQYLSTVLDIVIEATVSRRLEEYGGKRTYRALKKNQRYP